LFDLLLNWAVLAVSLYLTISLLWLGLMVLLSGNRRAMGTWLTGSGLLLGALFFTSHTAILGQGLDTTSLGMDFWWWVSWLPAIIAPLAWYGAMLWYSGYRRREAHPHRGWLRAVLALTAGLLFLLVFANPMPAYNYVAGRQFISTPGIAGIPLLILAYLLYSLLCYLLPLDLLRRPPGTKDPFEAVARRRARPWLVAASIFLLLAGIGLVWTALWALKAEPPPSLRSPGVEQQVLEFDLLVASLVAASITLLGRAIVAYEVFTGRPLPRRGFFRQWRSTVILATGYSLVVSGGLAIHMRPLYSLMMATALMTVFYALYSWRSFVEREHSMSQLRPFIASQDLYDQLVAGGKGDAPGPQALFDTLCREVLGVRAAALAPAGALAPLAGPPLVYSNGEESLSPPDVQQMAVLFPSPQVRCLALPESGAAWAVSLWHARGLGGVLLLSEKTDGNPFTDEEIEIAQAGGERLLDMLAGVEMARLAMDLLRQKIAQVRVLEGQGRRVLHDEVLPELHTAILYLSSRKELPEVSQALETLTSAHHRLSDLVRAVPPGAPERLAQVGLVSALQSLVENDFSREFNTLSWQVPAGAEEAARRLPPFASEVLFFAARELVRNAARYGRGPDPARPLSLPVGLQVDGNLRLWVQDDGVGLPPAGLTGSSLGSGSGLRFHSAMLAAIGGSLEVHSSPSGGTRGEITLLEISPSEFASSGR
jgi:signal transduction histidine kinase